MILVDSSVWIDYFNGNLTAKTDWLDSSLGNIPITIGDFILAEVLQGFQKDKDFRIAKDILLRFPVMPMGGQELAIESAMNYRFLRKKGVTVRKTIDVMIGTFCIHYNLPLLHDDRDFDPMSKFLGLEIIDV
ncbi:MAG TPA: PIN domain nuclease [Desulfobacteraceae bacterium]|nr:PIN domain nuclease [Desulfobacteraceae bacterium]HPJ66888.1 PIN domain nuclease [Desulfobacteraceae bacterium]HPQ27653.1 PIN domain nuclease [Desulfobacteraceae bacterium]